MVFYHQEAFPKYLIAYSLARYKALYTDNCIESVCLSLSVSPFQRLYHSNVVRTHLDQQVQDTATADGKLKASQGLDTEASTRLMSAHFQAGSQERERPAVSSCWVSREAKVQLQTLPTPLRRYQASLLVGREGCRIGLQAGGRKSGYTTGLE